MSGKRNLDDRESPTGAFLLKKKEAAGPLDRTRRYWRIAAR